MALHPECGQPILPSMPLESIALTFVPHLGVRGAAHLLECFGSARAIYESSAEELCFVAGLRDDVARSIASKCGMREAEREMLYCQRHGITPVACDSALYPHLLRETNDFPAVLYVVGDVNVLSRRAVGFVGTRKVTPYGQRMCNMWHRLYRIYVYCRPLICRCWCRWHDIAWQG